MAPLPQSGDIPASDPTRFYEVVAPFAQSGDNSADVYPCGGEKKQAKMQVYFVSSSFFRKSRDAHPKEHEIKQANMHVYFVSFTSVIFRGAASPEW